MAPSKIIALGLNYRDHIAESQSVKVQGFTGEVPREPVLFPKTPNVLIGTEAPIVIPAFTRSYGFEGFRVDHEAELAFFVDAALRVVVVFFVVIGLLPIVSGDGWAAIIRRREPPTATRRFLPVAFRLQYATSQARLLP